MSAKIDLIPSHSHGAQWAQLEQNTDAFIEVPPSHKCLDYPVLMLGETVPGLLAYGTVIGA